ncbi:CHASE2 domain-containing protein [Labrys monachus]|uniref:Adenylate cyclase n=1 Tax=Labrys monachus TaxID=217067 RepID=A0ABU0FEI2_9HYPH|nr:adenylate/guanylate cyclase domain-containing protein [Labrys monachus]MDQ0393020.1 adenylate cyclase [Labrys monachus]
MVLPLVAAALLTMFEPAPLPRLREIVFDSYQRWNAKPRDPDSPVRIVAIDEKSLAAVGQWPWPRDTIAKLTQKLTEAGAAAIAFDIVFGEPDQSSPDLLVRKLPTSEERTALERAMSASDVSHDATFARALQDAPAVLGVVGGEDGVPIQAKSGFAFAGDNPADFLPRFKAGIVPVPLLMAAAKGLGAVNWIPDGDSVIRKVPTLVSAGNKLVPTLSLEAVRIALGADTIVVRASNASGQTALGSESGINAIKVGDLVVQTEANGEIRLIARKADPSSWISASSVLDGSFSPDEVRGRIVFVGTAAIGISDWRSTPVETSIPGVEVHAQIVEQILAGANLVRPDWMRGVEAFLILALGGLLAWILRRTRNMPLVSTAAGLAIPLMIAGTSWLLFVRADVLLDAVMPSVGVLGVFIAGTLYHYQEAEHRRAEVRSMFGRFVTPAVVERLVEAPDRIVLGGEIRELTVMFSDVRDFTGLAERQTPEGVVSLIRRIHTPATDAVLRHNGTLDKFIGDGMMAFWNAPLDIAEHATLACLAALDIAAMADTFVDPAIEIGIGLHTGQACVGNLGSAQRLEYSALGDSVNLASRVEQLTKVYGVAIIVTEDTRTAVRSLPFLEIDRVTVRGRQAAISLFALHTGTDDQSFKLLQSVQADMLAAYRAGAFDQAVQILEANAEAYGEAYARLRAYYRRTIGTLRADPRPDWQGINQL